MKTDNLFYYIFLNFPEIFFELIDKPETEVNDYEFTSREVKQLSFRLDGLFLPSDNNSQKPFYLVEVQFQPDDNLYYRLFSEFFLFLSQYKPPYPWEIVVIYPDRNRERIQDHHFSKILDLNQVKRIYLDELNADTLGVNTVKLIIESEAQAIEKAKTLITQAKEQLNDSLIQKDFIDLIETIIVYKLPKKSREEIEAMLGLNSIKETKVYQEAFDEGEEKGQQIGEQRAKLALIPTLINEGFEVNKIAKMLELPLDIVQNIVNQK